jgi:hypothetical protein
VERGRARTDMVNISWIRRHDKFDAPQDPRQ